ncbi:recombination mediator RecR [Candidatus Dependentiae bacterium]|nr:recombination mediator RecR [Candidatus Dependentiae bacterium]
MIEKLQSFSQLIRLLQKVPYLASKNVYKVANHFLAMTPAQLEQFCAALQQAHQQLQRCVVCCAWAEVTTGCLFCTNGKRDQTIICVVETWQELMTIERAGGYTGVYHVLGGAISPLDGIGPDQLTITQLLARAEQAREIILATNQTPEGEATAAYLAVQLRKFQVPLTSLAKGVPAGSTLEYMDRLTVHRALLERRPF